jgi:threonine synthase
MANRGPRTYLEELRRAVMESPGATSTELRAKAATGADLPADLAPLVDKVRRHAYKVTDEDIAALQRAGHSDDELFELTCAAAVGVAIERRDKAFAACGFSTVTDGDKR